MVRSRAWRGVSNHEASGEAENAEARLRTMIDGAIARRGLR
jgi:hypothetical protein